MSLDKRIFLPSDAGFDAASNFNVQTYTGNGGSKSLTTGFQPDLVWIKSYSDLQVNRLYDSVRGVSYAQNTGQDNDDDFFSGKGVSAFNSDGFTVNDSSSGAYEVNGNGDDYVSWSWKAGGNANTFNVDGTGYASASAAGITDGEISLTGISVNTTAGFSIGKFTGTGNTNNTIAHGLTQAPEVVMTKNTTTNGTVWMFGSDELDSWGDTLIMNSQNAANSFNYFDVAPTSSVWSTYSGNSSHMNTSGATHIFYAWHSIEGYSKMGSYTGDGVSGNKITTGFQPSFLMVKGIDDTSQWSVIDSARGTSSETYWNRVTGQNLYGTPTWWQFDSDGFTINSTVARYNANNSKYQYMAFA